MLAGLHFLSNVFGVILFCVASRCATLCSSLRAFATLGFVALSSTNNRISSTTSQAPHYT